MCIRDRSDTVGHELSQAPELYVIKNRDSGTDNWNLYTAPTGTGNYMYLDGTAASASASNGFQYNTAPTASVFTLGTWDAVNKLNDNYIAYCFHSVDGYSKVGSFKGQGNADGPFIYTGFRPAWVFIKKSSASGDDWYQFDNKRETYNPVDQRLALNGTQAQGSGNPIDFLSNGIKIRDSATSFNGNNTTMLYMVFAEEPFKTTNAW